MDLINKLKNIVKKENEKLKFNILAEEWLAIKKVSIKKSTYYNYMYFTNRYIMSNFKNKTIEELKFNLYKILFSLKT